MQIFCRLHLVVNSNYLLILVVEFALVTAMNSTLIFLSHTDESFKDITCVCKYKRLHFVTSLYTYAILICKFLQIDVKVIALLEFELMNIFSYFHVTKA